MMRDDMSRPAGIAAVLQRPFSIALLVGVGFVPLMYWHIVGLLERPHYQFLLLLPVALWLLISTVPATKTNTVSNSAAVISVLLLAIAALGLGFATWGWSPWIAAISSLAAFSSVILGCGGWQRFQHWIPVWVFCWILVPLPFGMDEDLIVRLRVVTTRMTSAVLDQLGILHQSYASVIQLPQKPLFIADACSGIHSLYVLLAMALFLSMMLRRSILHSILLVFSTFGLVLIENVTRVVIVAAALGWNRDFSFGTRHTVLGVILFCLSALLILSIDQFLMFLLPEHPFGFLTGISWPWRKRKSASQLSQDSGLQQSSSALTIVFPFLAAVFPILGIAQIFVLPAEAPSLASIFPSDFKLKELGKDAMPKEIFGFTLQNYEMIHRVEGDPFGKSSQRWTYKKGRIEAGISLDYPYSGAKDLCECYSLVGWQIPEKEMLDIESLKERYQLSDPQGPLSRGILNREFFGQALLLFSSFDLQGRTTALVKDVARGDVNKRGWQRFETFGAAPDAGEKTPDQSGNAGHPVYIQVHLIGKSFENFTPEVQQELVQLFDQSRQILIPQVVASDENRVGAAVSGISPKVSP